MSNLKAAIEYHKQGYHPIPIKQSDKRPYVEWEIYQKEQPLIDEIDEWWHKWPDANIGLITGEVTNLVVVDVDNKAGEDKIRELAPGLKPHTKSPHGYHFWFDYHPGLTNRAKVADGIDIRTGGGYIIAPPGRNENGRIYSIAKGGAKHDCIPEALYSILKNGSSFTLSKPSNLYIEGDITNNNNGNNKPHYFTKGRRDEDLFHVANSLIRGSCNEDVAREVIEILARKCSPPFSEKETKTKINSALSRSENLKRNLTDEIRSLVLITNGNITTTFIQQQLQLTTSEDKKKANTILYRLEEKGLLEKTGRFAGEYRIVDQKTEPEDWMNADSNPVKIWLPLGMSNLTGDGGMVKMLPGDVALFAGTPNVGKTGFLLNIAKENISQWKVHYISSELRKHGFKKRLAKDKSTSLEMLKDIKFYNLANSRTKNFQDFVKPGEGNLNIFDYVESLEDPWKMGMYIDEIFRKLKGAIGIIAIQKKKGSEMGYGGTYTNMRPVLVVNLDKKENEQINEAKIIKCKEPDDFFIEKVSNPEYMKCEFNLIDGIKVLKKGGWHR